MAKQSGIHQLRGKVGEMSYYQSTGVPGGLVRRINQGMSARVKTAEAYANTRLNNQEFQQAAHISSALGSLPVPKFRPMFLPFSQSRLTKSILELIKSDTTHAWGSRNVADTNEAGAAMADALNKLSKNRPDEFCGVEISWDGTGENYVVTAGLTDDQLNLLESIGAEGVRIGCVFYGVAVGGKSPYDPTVYIPTTAIELDSSFVELDTTQADTIEFPLTTWGSAQGSILFESVVAVIMPYRTVNSKKYFLQEHCSFLSFMQKKQVV